MANTDQPVDPHAPTVNISNEPTPSTSDQVLAGIKTLREEVASSREEQKQLRADLEAFRKETAANISRLDDVIQGLVSESFDHKVDTQGVKNRLDQVERKAS
jgi:hypothetical protein